MDLQEYETIDLSAGEEYRVRVEVTEGEVQLAEVSFKE
jgi:hypothetical protein